MLLESFPRPIAVAFKKIFQVRAWCSAPRNICAARYIQRELTGVVVLLVRTLLCRSTESRDAVTVTGGTISGRRCAIIATGRRKRRGYRGRDSRACTEAVSGGM